MQKNKTGSEPLYKQIKNYLDTLIQQNFNNTEFRFPSENQIATRFHSSRVPVIQALKELVRSTGYKGKAPLFKPRVPYKTGRNYISVCCCRGCTANTFRK